MAETFNNISKNHSLSKPIKIRKVWKRNLHDEFFIIRGLIRNYPYISIDTEFPGVIHKPDPSNPIPPHCLSPRDQYHYIKKNVDNLELIQLGLTLTDRDGNLPEINRVSCIWEFNFSDFDPGQDPHNPDSVAFLKAQGINFELNRKFGIRSADFGLHAIRSGILRNESVTWVTFHSAYDFGYLVKILQRTKEASGIDAKLPESLDGFLETLGQVFGPNVYDIKHVMMSCDGLYGGLERVAGTVGVSREARINRQAGSDSLLIRRVFGKVREKYFDGADPKRCAGVLYGLNLTG